jgi:predicted DNA-binding protein
MTATATAKRAASIRLSASLNSALNEQAKQLKISKDVLVRRALTNMLEDIEDITESKRILADVKSGKEKTITLAQMKTELGL